MHSRIFQIETHPVSEDEFINVGYYDYDHWFLTSIADFICPDEDRRASIDWLKDMLNKGRDFIEYFMDDDGEGFIIKEGFRMAYFESAYEDFRAKLNKLDSEASPESFANGGLSTVMWLLEKAHNDKFGFYVDGETTGLMTLSEFIRCASAGVKYYIGGTIDYHC